ncbi:hypothetical protein [Pinibacter soli]|uniref:Uncharacterized protein n=1 Tax=Pinibacter soli TaxID=3044211 RepID=A0ABT6RHZ9_9BACT|nr:hypothetical protein [Pinibacter soli]MDI3322194.1 hypothetical protein [Pinibacter soli]
MPWGLIAIFFALTLFYYISRKTKARNEERRERLNEAGRHIWVLFKRNIKVKPIS